MKRISRFAVLAAASAMAIPAIAFAQSEPLPGAPQIMGRFITDSFRGDNAIQRGLVGPARNRNVNGAASDWGKRAVPNVAGNVSVGNLFVAATEWTHTYAVCPQGYALINNAAVMVTERSLGNSISFIGRPLNGQDNGFRVLSMSISRAFPDPEVQISEIAERPMRIGNANMMVWGPVTRARTLSAETDTYISVQPTLPWSYHHIRPIWAGINNWVYTFHPVCARPIAAGGGGNGMNAPALCEDGFCSSFDACMLEPPQMSSCGNMICDNDENAFTCPADCPAPTYCPSLTVQTEMTCDEDTVIYQGEGCPAICETTTPESGVTETGIPGACPAAECGNGVREMPEMCDDGNTANGDGCSSMCMVEMPEPPTPVCGNGTIEMPEMCDDGNMMNGDGCSSMCIMEMPEPPTPICGNGIMESWEMCDDGNMMNGDGCSSMCMIEMP